MNSDYYEDASNYDKEFNGQGDIYIIATMIIMWNNAISLQCHVMLTNLVPALTTTSISGDVYRRHLCLTID